MAQKQGGMAEELGKKTGEQGGMVQEWVKIIPDRCRTIFPHCGILPSPK